MTGSRGGYGPLHNRAEVCGGAAILVAAFPFVGKEHFVSPWHKGESDGKWHENGISLKFRCDYDKMQLRGCSLS